MVPFLRAGHILYIPFAWVTHAVARVSVGIKFHDEWTLEISYIISIVTKPWPVCIVYLIYIMIDNNEITEK